MCRAVPDPLVSIVSLPPDRDRGGAADAQTVAAGGVDVQPAAGEVDGLGLPLMLIAVSCRC